MFPILVIISLILGGYSFWSKHAKVGLGFICYAITFFALIPNLTSGLKSNFLEAFAVIMFVVGSVLIAYQKRPSKEAEPNGEPKSN